MRSCHLTVTFDLHSLTSQTSGQHADVCHRSQKSDWAQMDPQQRPSILESRHLLNQASPDVGPDVFDQDVSGPDVSGLRDV